MNHLLGKCVTPPCFSDHRKHISGEIVRRLLGLVVVTMAELTLVSAIAWATPAPPSLLNGTQWTGSMRSHAAGSSSLSLQFYGGSDGIAEGSFTITSHGAANSGVIQGLNALGPNQATMRCSNNGVLTCTDIPGSAGRVTRFTFILNPSSGTGCDYNVKAWSNGDGHLRGQYYCATSPSTDSGTFDLVRK